MRQLVQMIVQLCGEHRLQLLSGALVQLLAALDQQRVVSDLLRQRVLEDVLGVADRRLLVDELGELQLAEYPVQIVVRLERHPSHQLERKFPPQHRQGLQQLLLLRRKPVDACGEHALHRGGDLHRAHRLGQLHRPVALQHAVFEQRLHDLFHEERSALGSFDDQPLERKQIRAVAHQRREHLLRTLPAERIKPQLGVIGLAIPVM